MTRMTRVVELDQLRATGRYKVAKLTNTVMYDIGQYITKEEVNQLVKKVNLKVIVKGGK